MREKKDITSVVREGLCNSCGACEAVCQTNSITFRETVAGYCHPEIDYATCVACALCHTVCPGISFGSLLQAKLKDDPFIGQALMTYSGKAADKTILMNGQSGGIVTALLTHLFKTREINSAIVVTMGTANPPRPDIKIARNANELASSQKSKYCPVPLLCKVKDLGQPDYPAALVGLPCHIHGFYNILGLSQKNDEKIKYKIGLICDRVMLYSAIDFLIAKSGVNTSITHQLTFRDKSRTGYPGDVTVVSENGEVNILPASLRKLIKDYFTPARCRICFDKMNVFADITVGDPHGIQQIDRSKGESIAVVRTETGESLLNSAIQAHAVVMKRISYAEVLNGQKIQQKKKEWNSYIAAWRTLKPITPNYVEKIANTTALENIEPFRNSLAFSLSHERFKSRDELFRFFDSRINAKQKPVTSCAGRHVLIRGTGFENKGAELMLRGILAKIGSHYPDARYSLCKSYGEYFTIPAEKRRELGGYRFVPSSMKDLSIDFILDASGFAYGDQWGTQRSVMLAKATEKWRSSGKKSVLLPQAFGPFSDPAVRAAIGIIANNVNLIYARDSLSYSYLTDAVGKQPHIKMVPDLTLMVDGIPPADRSQYEHSVCIIPNNRMIDKTSREVGQYYLSFLVKSINYLLKSEFRPFMLIHEGETDYTLAKLINATAKKAIPIMRVGNPLSAKGIIGSCKGLISSRYHGLVSGLGQGVPSLAMGWSHKYQALFSAFNFPEGMVSTSNGESDTYAKLELLLDRDSSNEIAARLRKSGNRLKKQVDAMWDEIARQFNEDDPLNKRAVCDENKSKNYQITSERPAIDEVGNNDVGPKEFTGQNTNVLLGNLQRVGWGGKYALYKNSFEHVLQSRTVLAPSISIIVVSWRFHPDTLKNLEILQAQRDQKFELIFVDNGGKEREFGLLKPHVDTYVRLNTNTGAYLSRNVGAVFANAAILLFLDDDGIPENDLVKAHLAVHGTYDVVSVRGVVRPKSGTLLNRIAKHYYLGGEPFPTPCNIEGNASYRAAAFFAAGGWDDAISFGYGGLDLAIRLLAIEPDRRKQIYAPDPVLYHDFAKDTDHLKAKTERQQLSLNRLLNKHPFWHSTINSWQVYQKNRCELLVKDMAIVGRNRNIFFKDALSLYESGKIFGAEKCFDAYLKEAQGAMK